MTDLLRNARYALRLLGQQKAFTAAVLLTLALCIGANAAMFSVVNSVLLRPLPFPDADRLVHIYNSYPKAGVERGGAAAPDYYDRLEHTTSFTDIAMLQSRGMTVGEAGRPERVTGMAVTPSFFEMLRIAPAAGRTFTADEGEPGNELQAVLSHGYWQEKYAGSADALGATIRINDVAHRIVGVMPSGFTFADEDVRIWVPLAFGPAMRGVDARHSNNWEMIARLAPGASVESAQAQIDALNARNDEEYPQFREILAGVGFRTHVVDYRSDLVRNVRGTLWLLQGGVLFVLLIGCVNIANLILVRSTSRHRELATRSALGAGRSALVRQLLTESTVLAAGGGALGLLVGWAGVRAFAAVAAAELPRGTEVAFDLSTAAVAFVTALLAGLLFGAIPVARLLRADLSSVFRDEGRTGTASRTTNRWRGGLVIAQVSLAFALLIGAGLLVTSFARTLRVETGFDADGVLTASVSLPVTRYADDAARAAFSQRLLERVRAVPGVTDAAVTSVLPFGGNFNASAITPEGYEPRPDDNLIAPINSRVSDGYFESLGIEIVAGRAFNATDVAGAAPVAVIDELLAERFWPGQDPLGRRIAEGVPGVVGEEEPTYRTVVGVARNVRATSLVGDQPPGHFYMPFAQTSTSRIFLTVRTAITPLGVTNAVRAAVMELDPDMPVYDVRTMQERIATSLTTERARLYLIVAFAALALFLAAIGLYGVLAWSVAQRTGEIGIRVALGSSAAAVFRLVLSQGARLVAVGLATGLAAAILLARFVESMLFGVTPTEPAVYAGVLVLLSMTALVACVVPARRAMRVDPMTAMRG
jgi:predicted permease